MNHTFDSNYWHAIWASDRATAMSTSHPNPHLRAEVAELPTGTAIDAGAGAGAEAIWLAEQGWTVTAADIAPAALAFGRDRAARAGVADKITWVQADLSTWNPPARFDLVTTHYAHPDIPQLDFYSRIAGWVAPGGTLFIVGHLHHGQHHSGHEHGNQQGPDHSPPAEASATAAAITAILPNDQWEVDTAEESERSVTGPDDKVAVIHDVVVRAHLLATT